MPSFSILKRSPKHHKDEGQNASGEEDIQPNGNNTPDSDHSQSKKAVMSDDERKEKRGFKKPGNLLQDLRIRLVGKQPAVSTPQRGRGTREAPAPPQQRDMTAAGEVRPYSYLF
jgi:hypothetical protein